MESVNLRKFNENDIEKKIKWINDPKNNEFLHYNIPLNYENTLNWYIKNQNNPKRKDMIIEYNGIAVGVIGIINIDKKKGEYYITLGENEYKRKGISRKATDMILKYAFEQWNLEKVWLCVDEKNIAARNLYEKCGFQLEGFLRKDIFFKGEMINRCMYGIIREDWKDNEYINN